MAGSLGGIVRCGGPKVGRRYFRHVHTWAPQEPVVTFTSAGPGQDDPGVRRRTRSAYVRAQKAARGRGLKGAPEKAAEAAGGEPLVSQICSFLGQLRMKLGVRRSTLAWLAFLPARDEFKAGGRERRGDRRG